MNVKAADAMIDIIRGVIRSELDKRDGVEACEVRRLRSDGSCEVAPLSDPGSGTVSVANATALSLGEGDCVYLYKVGGRLSNSFVFAKPIPYSRKTASVSGLEASVGKLLASLGYTVYGTSIGLIGLSDGSSALGATIN